MANFTTLAKLKPGDEITVPTEASRLVSHHGIYVGGPENSVIHFSGFDPQSATLKKDTWEEFRQGRPVSKVEYPPGECRPNEETVKTVYLLLENVEAYPTYHLLTNNCEHFARLCKTGKKGSVQADMADTAVDLVSRLIFSDPTTANLASMATKAALSWFSSSS
jgi:hypothetical protein